MFNYVIFPSVKFKSIVFDDVVQSPDSLRFSSDMSNLILKFTGETPSWLDGHTLHTHEQIISVLNGDDWVEPIED